MKVSEYKNYDDLPLFLNAAEYGIHRVEESRERGTQGDTQAGRTTQGIGENGKRN